jgi:GrpB-like predicted nucleotidyltransferase (UPF0157 family)
VAERVASVIAEARPGTVIEHVGSTAVSHVVGKGVIDLLIAARPDEIPEIVETLLQLGFERQTDPKSFPPTRPLLQGCIGHDGDVFGLHCHVVPNDNHEVLEMRAFRDRLRNDARLREAYVSEKRRIVEAGITNPEQYSDEKSRFIVQELKEMGLRD